MNWTAYRVEFRLLTPMHVGAAKLGNLQVTRPYVHGKTLWGGLTARLTRDHSVLNGDYAGVGRQVNEEMAFSYLYPTTGDRVDPWPWDDPDQFAWKYLGSYASTALDYAQNSAEESSLHETEFIAPTTRDGQSVYLVGYIFVRDNCSLLWRESLKRLQLGGERSYGWGRLALKNISPETNDLFSYYRIDPSGTRPQIMLTDRGHLLAHAYADGARALAARGRLAPLVGRETVSATAHGRSVSLTAICWEPGAVTDTPVRVAIGPYGIWEAAAP